MKQRQPALPTRAERWFALARSISAANSHPPASAPSAQACILFIFIVFEDWSKPVGAALHGTTLGTGWRRPTHRFTTADGPLRLPDVKLA